ncbi:ATP-binding protein [Kutzneria albida]|uniref:ATP-binding protein n=1 Tax=Kutzneria albida TaxID=43357 RepID=UPI00130EC5F8|nr:tetratricopeptide repeat protein [Kutzneria albida]
MHNDFSGTVEGAVVQAAQVDQLHIHGAGRRPVIPAQLPPPPRLFTSRRRELADLETWRVQDHGGPSTMVISGAGGVGKTTLALRWLHEARRHFPDGQLYANLGAFSGTNPVDPSEVLEWFLSALGVPVDRIPLPLSQREALYRSLTADRSVAVLLDDVLSAAQVRPLLLASPKSVVVVTSRWRLTGLRMVGARFIELDPMDVAESVELLDEVVGDGRLTGERRHAEELAHLCGGMPMALSVVGARLSAHPRRTLAREVDVLRGSDRLSTLSLDDDYSVEVVFDASYKDLPPMEAQLYRLCALHPGSVFGVDVAAGAVQRAADEVEPALDALVDRNMLSEINDRRFRYHDLLLIHARQQANLEELPQVRDAVVRRMIEWYLDMVVAADLVLRPTRRRVGPRFHRPAAGSRLFTVEQEALHWLEDERSNVVLAARSAAAHGWDQLVWELCEALWGFFLHTRHYSDWLELHRIGIPAAQRCGHRIAEARLRIQLASALTNLRRHEDAIQENLLAMQLAEQEHDEETKAAALSELAGNAQGMGDLRGALAYLYQAKKMREETGSIRAVALARRRIGEVLAELGQYEEAITELRTAVAMLGPLDKAQKARALTSLGQAYARCGRIRDAQAELAEALEITRQVGSARYQAEVITVLGEVAELTGDLSAARTYYSKAHAVYSPQEDPKAADLAERLARLPKA